ncbi:PAP2 superfamily protein [Chlamydoabsidia padenii]|nr:PAP2 superfamily protein [Chlamydoabsidia padenii]
MPHLQTRDALTSLSLTHVQFDAKDPVAYAMAYITLTPLAILVFYASNVVSRRELVSVIMLLGQLTNELVNAILKEYFQIHRPYDYLGTGYGMPSSHAQFVWYFATFGTIYLLRHIQLTTPVWKKLSVTCMVVMACLVCWSRIYLGYHTLGQVVMGSVVGVGYGLVWYMAMEMVRARGYLTWFLNTSLARWLLLRDMRDIDNVLEWEYQYWSQTMRRKTL